jgi:hypothetical protein
MRLLSACVCALVTFALANAGTTVVQTNSGPVEGYEIPIGLIWQGIPYAQPPIGQQRWQNPAAVLPWSTTKETKAFGPACPQVPYPRAIKSLWFPPKISAHGACGWTIGTVAFSALMLVLSLRFAIYQDLPAKTTSQRTASFSTCMLPRYDDGFWPLHHFVWLTLAVYRMLQTHLSWFGFTADVSNRQDHVTACQSSPLSS